jgi:hypothetical protein
MAIAIFSKKTFQVSSSRIYTLNDFSLKSGLNTESQDVTGKKPSTYVKGGILESMSFSIPVGTSMGINARGEYEGWKSIMEAGMAYPFILGGKPVGNNKWLLKSVSLGNTKIDSKGYILSAALDIEFEEYVRPGSVQKNSTSNNTSSKKGPAIKPKGSKAKKTTAVKNAASSKNSKKRNNRSVALAMSKGLLP